MPWYRTPSGMTVHVNFGGRRNKTAPPACRERRPDGTACGWMTGYQCDWKVAGGITCDRHLCEAHAFEIDKDHHLCPEHVASYRAWLREQGVPCF